MRRWRWKNNWGMDDLTNDAECNLKDDEWERWRREVDRPSVGLVCTPCGPILRDVFNYERNGFNSLCSCRILCAYNFNFYTRVNFCRVGHTCYGRV